MDVSAIVTEIDQRGFSIVPGIRSVSRVRSIRRALESYGYGDRNLLAQLPIRALAVSPSVKALVDPIIGPKTFAVRAILFDKFSGANWRVVWHQDRAIAVARQTNVPGFGGWSRKQGIPHTLAPVEVLERMVSVRLHLDDCGADNGPLRVVPKSHWLGIIAESDIESCRKRGEVSCTARSGDAIIMRPLLLHASSKSQVEAHRRVVHIEFASEDLPGDLRWHSRIA